MKEEKNEFPKGITKEVIFKIYNESGYSDYAENIYENPTIEVSNLRIIVFVNWYDIDPTIDCIWSVENGFKFCPIWVYTELVKRGLAPEIRNNEKTKELDISKHMQWWCDLSDNDTCELIVRNKLKRPIKDDEVLRLYNLYLCENSTRNIKSLTEKEWISVFEAGRIDCKSMVVVRGKDESNEHYNYVGISTGCKDSGGYMLEALYYIDTRNFESDLYCGDIDQYAAFKRLEELGVDLTK